MKLFNSEIRVMKVLWEQGDMSASNLSDILKKQVGWSKNTTYTNIKRCIDAGAIERYEPKFMCRAIISREEVEKYKTDELIDKMFDGSKERFFASFIDQSLTIDEINALKEYIEKLS